MVLELADAPPEREPRLSHHYRDDGPTRADRDVLQVRALTGSHQQCVALDDLAVAQHAGEERS